MARERSYYSPNILIYLELNGKKVRLSDVLYDTATLYEPVECAPNTKAALVFSIDEIEEREDIFLDRGISKDEKLISFSYANS